ncbi:MAG TPA: 50S ribosomal protein L23 [Saprospiraceae bacterium]|nr:50S ribosomal protein L23 [Saprospiraceae bacterium]MCC6689132.1 50S ribosomal protein L23 [Saprospiraceae bacterium]HMV24213.1 50S ribosomal protein L23 [Saprospiraceae bacterium]HMW75161.1 50S ribosomal protein L23 [Saprospiraceae bacterium]HMX82014.1 50S ribosomal protein L23 [Saprospiraceae bacterium]
MSKNILIKPLITEKTEQLTTKRSQYTFVVDKKSNKIEIKNAVEKMYSVNVESVNTAIMPTKYRTRNTKAGLIKGRVSGVKKAVITLADGEQIDYFGEV